MKDADRDFILITVAEFLSDPRQVTPPEAISFNTRAKLQKIINEYKSEDSET